MRTIQRHTYQLQDGDVVQTHGSRYRVQDFQESQGARWCVGQYLGPVTTEAEESIRRRFPEALERWTIQGNSLAFWDVETPE